jgi:hypothetical protein
LERGVGCEDGRAVMVESEAPSRGRIFISYRREETAAYSGWLYDRLAARYPDEVFKDIDSIELGGCASLIWPHLEG